MSPLAPQADDHALHDVVAALYRAAEHPEIWQRWLEEHRQRAAESPVLARHLRHADGLRRSFEALRHERVAITMVLDHIPVPVVLVDRDGGALTSNSAARRLASDGSGLTLSRQAIAASTPEQTRRLIAAIRGLTSERIDGQARPDVAMTLPRAADQPPLHVLIVALGETDEWRSQDGRVAAALFIGDPSCKNLNDGERMKRLFHFTVAETRVAVGLANGCAVNQLAQELGLSRNTVRWHVKHVLQKAAVKTQAQFVRLIHRSPAGLL
jgi:DNA-binding CsgD family transcriptional regulator